MKHIIFFGALVASFLARAQDQVGVSNMGGGGFSIGYGNLDVSGLHQFVPAAVPSFGHDQLLLGGSGYGFIGRLVLGGGGSGVMGDDFVTDTVRGSISGGYGTFEFGYAVVNHNRLKFFPMIGIGAGGYGVNMTKTGNLTVSDIRNEVGKQIAISQGGFMADVSLNLYTIPKLVFSKEDNSYGGFMVGLKVGYVYSMPSSLWSYSGGDIVGGPEFGFSMPYAKLVLGGFGFTKEP